MDRRAQGRPQIAERTRGSDKNQPVKGILTHSVLQPPRHALNEVQVIMALRAVARITDITNTSHGGANVPLILGHAGRAPRRAFCKSVNDVLQSFPGFTVYVGLFAIRDHDPDARNRVSRMGLWLCREGVQAAFCYFPFEFRLFFPLSYAGACLTCRRFSL